MIVQTVPPIRLVFARGETVTEVTQWALKFAAQRLLFICGRPEFMTTAIRDSKAVFLQGGRTPNWDVCKRVRGGKWHSQRLCWPHLNTIGKRPLLHLHDKNWIREGASTVSRRCGVGRE